MTFPLSVATARSPHARVRAAIDAHYDLLWRFLRRLGVPSAHVEDAAQEVLVVFARRIGEVTRGAEKSFLLATALKVASDARRKHARAAELPGDERLAAEVHPQGSAEDLLDQARRRAWLDVVLDALADDLRAVLVMCELEEMTMAQVAELLELPPGTVASRLRRAREAFDAEARALRARLAQEIS